jgi:ATP-binding cassette subfamily B protein
VDEDRLGLGLFLRRLLSYLRPYRLQVLLILFGILFDLAFDTALRVSFKFLIDDVLVRQNYSLLVTILVALCIGVAASSVVSVGRDFLYARVGSNVLNDLRSRTFAHLQRLSAGFYARTNAGDVVARFTTDLASVESALVLALPGGVMSLLGVLIAVVPLFLLEWRLALLALAGLPLCFLGPKLLERPAASAGYLLKEEQAGVTGAVQETVAAQAVVKAFGLQRAMAEKFRHRLASLLRIGVRSNFLNYLMERTPGIATTAVEIVIIGVGSFMAYQGHLTIGALVSFYVLFVSVSQSVSGVAWIVPYLVQAAVGLRRIEELLEEAPQVADAPGAAALPRLSRAISFRAVSFGYGAGRGVLTDLNLDIPGGTSVAIVGPSGSGKSTVLNLLMRFYDPTSGTVAFDGHDLRAHTQDSLRAQIGAVFQESFLFDVSVRENIRLGHPAATDEEVERAARAAELHEAILALPDGYDTRVGERGGRLSGGQRQRVALARAILRDPAILVLDEATSALDPSTEAAIHGTLERLSKGRTVISVTHRLTTVVNADRILVMKDGRVAEQGTHRELLNKKGAYREMWREFTLELTQEALVGHAGEGPAVVPAEDAADGADDGAAPGDRALQAEIRRQGAEIQRLQTINQRWVRLAGTDRLTGLPNKIAFLNATVPQQIQQARTRRDPLGFMLVSGDNLGPINETFGREAGDGVLKELAGVVHGFLRGDEHLGHIDGVNFAVCSCPSDFEQTRSRAEELRVRVAAHDFRCGDASVHITVSVGVGSVGSDTIGEPREGVEDIFRKLNQALYRAKRAGGNRLEAVAAD